MRRQHAPKLFELHIGESRKLSFPYSLLCVTSLLILSACSLDKSNIDIKNPKDSAPTEKGELVLSPNALFESKILEELENPADTISVIAPNAKSFSRALRISKPKKLEQSLPFRLSFPLKRTFEKGEILEVHFFARTFSPSLSTGENRLHFGLRNNVGKLSPRKGVRARTFERWTEFTWPFRITEPMANANISVEFDFSYSFQDLAIANLQVRSYSKKLSIDEFRSKGFEYRGVSASAKWRKEAEQRIEAHRKGEFKVTVLNSKGRPIDGAQVKIAMKRHAFRFGSAVSAPLLLEDSPDARTYRKLFLENFNSATIENALKMRAWYGDWDISPQTRTLEALSWLKEQNIYARGHAAVWPNWNNVPNSYRSLKDNPKRLKQEILNHITDITSTTKGLIDEWDILNEPSIRPEVLEICGEEAIHEWFDQARKVLPETPLYINDFNNIELPNPIHRQFYLYSKAIRLLLKQNAPLNGIGLQSHFLSWNLPSIEQILSSLDYLASFGLPLAVTEFDVDISDQQLQADFTRDFLTATFSHPMVNSFTFWGFWENAHWLPQAALFKKDWSPRKIAHVYRELVFERWWTNAEGKTDSEGVYSLRGFLGEYELSVKFGSKEKTRRVRITREGSSVVITL